MVKSRPLKVDSAAKNILIIGPSWVGDMVMAQSLFIRLKQLNPDCRIDVLAPAWSLPLLERMPEVRSGISMPLNHGEFGLLTRIKLGVQLRSVAYQQAIVLPNSWKSALIPFFANIPLRTGYLGEARWGLLNDARPLDKHRLKMTVQRFLALGEEARQQQLPQVNAPRLSISNQQQDNILQKFNLTQNQPILALCPGAEYGPAKRWPAQHFARVAQEKQAQGWQVWLFGSGKDNDIAEEINTLSGGICRNFAGQTTLGEAVDLLSLAQVVVSNDSGLMHIAAALDKKLIAVYGSSDPGFTPPLNPQATIVYLNLECSPCFARQCPLQHTRCLTEIAPQTILDAIAA